MTLLVIMIMCSAIANAQDTVKWGNWHAWGQQADNTYRNPVLPADYSDVDCIRVGEDYYAISSTFQYSPGMVILHSKDLVNWTIAGHVVNDISKISPEMNWDKMNRYGKGIWAGAIRYHNHKYWVYFGTPNEGYFMSTATNPNGPWEPVSPVLAEAGWDDCCPFWDDDGQGYLVGTHFSDNYSIHLFKLSADGRKIIEGTDKVIHQSKGSEANKFYKINGWYYHLYSEVKPEGRTVMMERSKNIEGPFTETRQLNHAERQYNEPNQGGLVQTPTGDWYFLTHHGRGDWSGRVLSLLPVTWQNGWPIIGKPGPDGIGHMVWNAPMPAAGNNATPQTSDEFLEKQLPPQWEWNYQPRGEKWSLSDAPGWLRLYAFKPLQTGDLLKAGNTLTQRVFRTPFNEVITKLDISHLTNGERAGLAHFGSPNYAALGVVCHGDTRTIELNIKGVTTTADTLKGKLLWLKSTWGLDGVSHFYYSTDGQTYTPAGDAYQLQWGSYRGDRIALYNYNDFSDTGYVDVDYFRYLYK
jgi:beta-xylosidase